jgi:hypothetical protein
MLSLGAGAATPEQRSTYFDGGATAGIGLGSSTDYEPTIAMTVEAWIYREDASRCETIVGRNYQRSYWFGVCGGALRFYRSGGVSADADVSIGDGNWVHVAAAYDGTTVKFYLDGLPVGEKPLSNTALQYTEPLSLGADVTGYPFAGHLDEVRIWSEARSQSQIQQNLYRELTGAESDLILHQPFGGSTSPARASVFGILPRELTIPTAATTVTVDGRINLGDEYAGAEQQVIRYGNNAGAPDAVVYYVYRNYGGNVLLGIPPDRNLYAGVRNVRAPIGDWRSTNSWIALHFDRNRSREALAQSDDFQVQLPLEGQGSQPPVPGIRWGNGAGGYTDPTVPLASVVETAIFYARGDVVPPDMEFRINASLFPDYWDPMGMAAGHYWIGGVGQDRFGPGDARWNAPVSWAGADFGDNSVLLPRAILSGVVRDRKANGALVPVPGQTVYLTYPGLGGEIIAETVTDEDGEYAFLETVAANEPLEVQLAPCEDCRYLESHPRQPEGIDAVSRGPWRVTYPGCVGGDCEYGGNVFEIRTPVPAIELSSFAPVEGNTRFTLSTDPLKQVPGSEVTIYGGNLHEEIRVYIHDCTFFPLPGLCDEGPSYFEAPIMDRAEDETWVTVQVPEVPPTMQHRRFSWAVQDLWDRLGRVEWQQIGTRDDPHERFRIGVPPFPRVYGFEFENVDDGTQFDEFSNVYQWHAYNCYIPPFGPVIPAVESCPGCRVPDPVYFAFYGIVFTPWVELMTGTCLGMSVTARQFELGYLDIGDFRADTFYPAGFPGVPDVNAFGDAILAPPKPQEHRFRFCDYSIPVNLWAFIHRNQAAQVSAEFFNEILSQMDGTGVISSRYSIDGDPNAVLARLRSNLRDFVLGVQQSGDLVKAHSVTPYEIIDGKALHETDGLRLVDDPDSSVIRIYDSNWPERTDRYIEIDRVANEFRYYFGDVENDEGDFEPEWWHGTSIYTVPVLMFNSEFTMPGADILARGVGLLLFGSGDALYADGDGGEWGWNPDGSFVDTYEGAKAIAPFTPTAVEANDTRAVWFFPPQDSPPANIRVNARGGDYTLFGGETGLISFLKVHGVPDGEADEVLLTTDASVVKGFQLIPQSARDRIEPSIGVIFDDQGSLLFSWEGVQGVAGQGVEFVARRDKAGAEFFNNTDQAQTPRIKLAHGIDGGLIEDVFGPFAVPPGASQTLSAPAWPDHSTVLYELDENQDGVAEYSFTMIADPGTGELPGIATETRNGELAVSWPAQPSPWVLEEAVILNAATEWMDVSALQSVEADRTVVLLPLEGDQRFFRIRRAE